MLIPKIYVNNREKVIFAYEIYYSAIPDYFYMYSIILAINAQKDLEEPAYKTILIGVTRLSVRFPK